MLFNTATSRKMKPNFLIIGAAKSGTSSLFYYLRQHPDVFMSSLKEPKFFALEGQLLDYKGPDQGININSVTTLKEYMALFTKVRDESAIGEASPLYLYSNSAAQRIKHYIPKVKLIVVLRNPVDRAFSSYTHLLRDGLETLSFADGLQAESERIHSKWSPLYHYRAAGFYYQQLSRYFELFPSQQIKIYLHEELNQNSLEVVQDIFRFIGVDDSFIPDLKRSNVSGIPKSRFIHSLLKHENPAKSLLKPLMPKVFRENLKTLVSSRNLGEKPKLDLGLRQELVKVYRRDISMLQSLIDRDLSHWMS